jgi:hypothetical protein
MSGDAPAALDQAWPAAPLDALREPAVRDLAWLLFSADLLRAQPPRGALADCFATPEEARATRVWLQALDADPAALLRALAAARITRLGRYAECLLGWFLQQGPAAWLVAANVPLRRAGVTLGECDFLLRTRDGRRLHWELAVKCYLHVGDGQAQLADYVGPDLRDRFDLKLAHLLTHQLPLSAREEFASLGLEGPWEPQMFVKGWLFYRYGEAPPEPAQLAPAHGRGWWTTRSAWRDFAARMAQPGMRWRVLPRLEWLAPRHDAPASAQHAPWFDAHGLAAHLGSAPGPVMVAAALRDEAGGHIESSRGFIVPDDWPQRAQGCARAAHHQR